MKRELTCIACPLGCSLTVTLEGKTVISVEGNTCPRGKDYAINECTAPVRTVTSTVMCENGDLVSVKTKKPIPKDKIFEAMSIINKTVASLPISVGDIIIEDLFGSPLVATQDKK
jgi:CxxC motif-containing protein